MKKILIAYDVDGWAWHSMALGIQKYAPPEYSVDIMNQTEFGKITGLRKKLSKYDAISQCSWVEASTAIKFNGKHTTWIASHGLEHDFPADENDFQTRIVTRIRNKENAAQRIIHFDEALCVSDRLYETASELGYKCRRVVPGVDDELFTTLPRMDRSERLTIGWSGQEKGNTKGYEEILVPVMDRMDGVDWRVNRFSAGDCLDRHQMSQWYRGLDMYLSTSFSEGFQMTILEAMSSGVPVIATDCGGANECINTGIDGFIVDCYNDERSAVKTTCSILETIGDILFSGDNNLISMAEKCRKKIVMGYSWRKRAEEWLKAMAE